MKKHDRKPFAAIAGATLVTSLSGGVVQASENPFAVKELASGYNHLAQAEPAKGKPGASEMKCGVEVMKNNPEMKCGASMMKMEDMKGMKMDDKTKDQKAMEGKCAGMKMEGAPATPSATPAK